MRAWGAQKWGQGVQVLLPRVWSKKQRSTVAARGRSRVKRKACVLSMVKAREEREWERETGWGWCRQVDR